MPDASPLDEVARYYQQTDPMSGLTPEQSAEYLSNLVAPMKRRFGQYLTDASRLGSTVGNYLSEVPSNVYSGLEWASKNVAEPFIEKQADLFDRDYSKEPLVGWSAGGYPDTPGQPQTPPAVGHFTGRLPALAEFVTPYLQGAAPPGSFSAGMRLPSGHEGGYHGTPHTFQPTAENPLGVFKDEAMGTGQGSQVRGWGHYIGGAKGTGESYRPPELDKVTIDGKPWTTTDVVVKDIVEGSLRDSQGFGVNPDPKYAIEIIEEQMAGLQKSWNEGLLGSHDMMGSEFNRVMNQYIEARKVINDNINTITLSTGPGGNLYHVALPPKEEALLDLEKNLGEQSPEVKAVIAKINADRFQREYPPNMNAEDFQSTLLSDPRVAEYREKMGIPNDRYGHAKAVSKWLNEQGIPGNRFYDQGSRYLEPVLHYGEKPIKTYDDALQVFKQGQKDPYYPPQFAIQKLFDHSGDIEETLNYLKNAAVPTPGGSGLMVDVYQKAERWLQRNRDKFSMREPQRTYNYVMFGPEHTDIVDVEK